MVQINKSPLYLTPYTPVIMMLLFTELSVKYTDIQFGQLIGHASFGSVYQGGWKVAVYWYAHTIKKFWGLDFSELYILSSNPAALMIGKQLFSHAFTAMGHWVKGSPSRVKHFMHSTKRVHQAMGLCLVSLVSLVKPHDTGSKFRNYGTIFKIQEKWRNVIANHHRTMDKCDILTK